MTDLYRSPTEVLRREIDHLKVRLKSERDEVNGLAERLAVEKSEGLAKLLDICQADMDATTALITDYRRAIRKLEGR